MSDQSDIPSSPDSVPSISDLLSGKHGAPSVQVIHGGSPDGAKLLELLKGAMGAATHDTGLQPLESTEVEALYMKAAPVQLWDIVQLREEFDCTTPTLLVGVDYVVVRALDRPIYQVNDKNHAITTVDVAVGLKSNHGDHSHYVEIAVDSRRLTVIGNLSSLLNT